MLRVLPLQHRLRRSQTGSAQLAESALQRRQHATYTVFFPFPPSEAFSIAQNNVPSISVKGAHK